MGLVILPCEGGKQVGPGCEVPRVTISNLPCMQGEVPGMKLFRWATQAAGGEVSTDRNNEKVGVHEEATTAGWMRDD